MVWPRVATVECKKKARFWIHYIFKVETTGFVTDQMGHVRKSGVRDGPRSLAWQLEAWGGLLLKWARLRGATLEAQFGAVKFEIPRRQPNGDVRETNRP